MIIDLYAIGDKIGRLTILDKRHRGNFHYAFCECECGTRREIRIYAIADGTVSSCGCLRKERSRAACTRHGHSPKGTVSPTFSSYRAMLNRCQLRRSPSWAIYGGRGITICDRWVNGAGEKSGFQCFLEDMGERPKGRSIDRIDNDGNYEPDNCRWASSHDQARNRRTNNFVVLNGRRMLISEALRETGVPVGSYYKRIEMGWSQHDALTAPSGATRPA